MPPHELTHASFFSGVGGLDLGLERAGWRTVSFSEIDPYASAVLAERWPGVVNLGDITDLAEDERWRRAGELLGDAGVHDSLSGQPDEDSPRLSNRSGEESGPDGRVRQRAGRDAGWTGATLWTGGFPCQDLSVAGKRRGMGTEEERTRSGLAYAFLDLVERHRPPAILLENVPGLLSSNGGKDLGALLDRLGNLGYWWAYRILDAQFFGVPQRRRRVFICALHAGAGFGADSPAAVLSVGARCGGHSATGDQEGQGASGVLADGARSTRTVQSAFGHHGWTLGAQDVDGGYLQLSPSPDPDRVREADGLAGRLDDRQLSPTLRVGPQRPQDGGPGDTVPIIVNAIDQRRGGADDNEAQAGQLIADSRSLGTTSERDAAGLEHNADSLPLGLDSHRYRCCGNGVVSNVSEWIGHRLARAVA